MFAVSPELTRCYESRLAQKNILMKERPHYHKWLHYYLDFCNKYNHTPTDRQSLPAFQEKLHAKHQPEYLCQQAGRVVSIYWDMLSPATSQPCPPLDAAIRQDVVENKINYHTDLKPTSFLPSQTQNKSPELPTDPIRALSQNDTTDLAEPKSTGVSWAYAPT